MQIDPRITMHDLPRTEALEWHISGKVRMLGKLYPGMTGCHILLARPEQRRQKARLFSATVTVDYPQGEVEGISEHENDLYIAIRDAFAAVERELQKAASLRVTPTAGLKSKRAEYRAIAA